MSGAETKLFALLGWPVAHSRSPAMHTAALAALGEDAVYLAFAVPPAELEHAVSGLKALGVRGTNITLPHKTSVIPLLDELEPAALAIGAVNTLTLEGDRLIGTNTDAAGLRRSLEEAGVALEGAEVLVVGAGGAARAAVYGLAEAGAAEVRVAARRVAQAEAVIRALAPHTPATRLSALDLGDAARLRAAMGQSTLLVQASSATLDDGAVAEAFARSLRLEALPPEATVVDLVYAPRETRVLREARRLGLARVEGLGMLVHQAALALERWLGRPAPVEALYAAVGGRPRTGV